MSETSIVEIGLAFLGALLGIIGWLLSSKDSAQGELIKDLYRKQEADEKELNNLRLIVSESYHKKPEVERMFDGFKKYLDEKFGEIKASLNEVNNRRQQ